MAGVCGCCPWTEHSNDTGRKFYHNAASKETQWVQPPAFSVHSELRATLGTIDDLDLDELQEVAADDEGLGGAHDHRHDVDVLRRMLRLRHALNPAVLETIAQLSSGELAEVAADADLCPTSFALNYARFRETSNSAPLCLVCLLLICFGKKCNGSTAW